MGTVGAVLRLPDVRRVELGWGLSLTGQLGATVALVAYAFAAGGAVLVAAYAASCTLGGAAVALGLSGVAGRVRRDALLRWLAALGAVLLALAAVTAAAGGPPVAVVVLAAASSSVCGTYRPLQVAILPWLVRTPAELASTNAVSAMLENAGSLAGPLLAGALLAFTAAWISIALAAGFLGLATVSLLRLRVPAVPGLPDRGGSHVLRDIAGGLKEVASIAPPGGVAILAFLQTFVRGALVVLIAVLAVKTLALGSSAVGWLNAAIGAGGMVGAAAAAAWVGVTRLGRSFISGLLVWGLPLAVLALALHPAVAYLALLVVGIGNAVEDVAGFTLIARSVKVRDVARVLAALEFVAYAGMGAGSVAAPLLLAGLGIRGTLLLLGGGLAATAALHARRFARLDQAVPAPTPQAGLLRKLEMFAPLPLGIIEHLETELRPHHHAQGATMMREGEPGADFHVIVSGSAQVSVQGQPRRRLQPGDGFGEIALLRSIPRTATIVAEQPTHTLALGREVFLAAVTGNSQSSAAAEGLATSRLAADPGRDQPPSS